MSGFQTALLVLACAAVALPVALCLVVLGYRLLNAIAFGIEHLIRWLTHYRQGRLDLAVVFASGIAGYCLSDLLQVLATTATPSVWATAGVILIGTFFTGWFAGALASDAEVPHAIGAGLVLVPGRLIVGGLLLAPVLLAEGGGEVAPLPVSDLAGAAERTETDWAPLIAWSFVLLATLPVAGGAGWLNEKLRRILRSKAPRQAFPYVTSDGREIMAFGPWRHPRLAFFWHSVGAVFLLTFWLPLIAGGNVLEWIILGLICLAIGRQRLGTSARDALANDQRPPILFLRSFADDGKRWDQDVVSAMSRSLWTLVSWTAEQRLGRIIRHMGPFIAIGRPGEELPESGAARMYVDDADWQDVVGDLLNRAQLVVFQMGETEGLRWELESLVRQVPPEKVILFAPYRFAWIPRWLRWLYPRKGREEQYQRFTAWANQCLPDGLPSRLESASFVYFQGVPSWQPQRLRYKHPPAGEHPLKTLLARLARHKAFRPRPAFGSPYLGGLVLVLVLALSALLVPALVVARQAALRQQSINNLKTIGLALHNYHDMFGSLPAGQVTDETGTPRYSWRTAILPFIEQSSLFERYDRSRAWNAPENRSVVESMVEWYRSPADHRLPRNGTSYLALDGPGTVFQANQFTSFRDITDGAANTVLVVEVLGANIAWAEPRDLDLKAVRFSGEPGDLEEKGILALFADGSVQYLENVSLQQLQALATYNGGEVVAP